jgi:predicted transcriptional regulator
MSSETRIEVGQRLEDDLKRFGDAWRRAEAGDLRVERVLSFESWDALAKVLTGERYRLLRHVHARPARSINALALELKRQYRRVHEDVRILEAAGLIDRSHGEVRAATDRLRADVLL